MLSLILGFIPGLIKPFLDYFTARQNAQVQMYMAKTGADRDAAISALQATTQIQSRWWFVAALQPLFAFPFLCWTWKAVIWDKLITGGTGSTDPLTGSLGWAYTIIISSIFVHGILTTMTAKK